MDMYVYCPRKSGGAFELMKALEAKRVRRFDGMNFWEKGKKARIPENSVIVCWGASLPALDNMKILNSRERRMNKYDELYKLAASGVRVPETFQPDGVNSDAAYAKAGYIGRANDHEGGRDIIGGRMARPDYYTKKYDFVREVRIHSFEGKSIRAGIKVHREGFVEAGSAALWRPGMVHPWIRSFDAGWRINYDGFKSTPTMRAQAHKAVKALGLTFGAVDIGIDAANNQYVLEVNSAPGIEGGSLTAYVKAIRSWAETGHAVEEDGE